MLSAHRVPGGARGMSAHLSDGLYAPAARTAGTAQRSAFVRAALLPARRCQGPGLRLVAMQAGSWGGTPQSPQPGPQPRQPQPQAQPVAPLAPRGSGGQPYNAGLAPAPAPALAPAAAVLLELSQVLNKPVVTRTSGRCLGTISGAWLDPARGTLVSFDLDDRRPGAGGGGGLGALSTPARAGNIPLAALRQIGDVVLVHDEAGLYEQDLDSRLGFINPLGLDVRTRGGEFLGKVRDVTFSPDSGGVARLTYDEFGLPFLPLSFFDAYSVGLAEVLSIGRGEVLLYDDARYRERRESAGLFAAIPSLLRSVGSSGGGGGGGRAPLALPAPGGGVVDAYRGGSRALPADYTYDQWQADLRRWEAETGMTYEQYLRGQSQQPVRAALPPARGGVQQPGYGGYGMQQYAPSPSPQQQQYGPPASPQPLYGAAPPLQQSTFGAGDPMQQQQQPPYGAAAPRQPQQPVRYDVPSASYPAQTPAQAQAQQLEQLQQQQRAAVIAAQQAAAAAQQAQAAAAGWAPAPARSAPAAAAQVGANPAAPYAARSSPAQRPTPQQQQQQPQQQQQGAAPAPGGVGMSARPQPLGGGGAAAAGAAAGQWPAAQPAPGGVRSPTPAQQQQQQQQQEPDSGRPMDEWLVRDGGRPHVAAALAEGVLPLTDEASGSGAGDSAGAAAPVAQQEAV